MSYNPCATPYYSCAIPAYPSQTTVVPSSNGISQPIQSFTNPIPVDPTTSATGPHHDHVPGPLNPTQAATLPFHHAPIPSIPSPATVEPPRKRPRVIVDDGSREAWLKKVSQMSDNEAFGLPDQDILDSLSITQKSPAWSHYRREVRRSQMSDNSKVITIVYRCRHNEPKHLTAHQRDRLKHSQGTSNLLNAARACDRRRNGQPQTSAQAPVLERHSEARHRAIIAVRCAARKRTFNSVADPEYLTEMQLVSGNPNIRLPSPHTVQRDVERLYEGMAALVTSYFKKRDRVVHVVIDGWTAPIHTSNIGIVLVWEDNGKLYRTLLELVKLTERHTGEYLAMRVAKTLQLYQLDRYMHLLNQDNASNCDTTAVHLATHITTFRGLIERLRCLLHAVQIVANMIESFFNKQYKRKRVTGAAGTNSGSADTSSGADLLDADEQELREILTGEIETDAAEVQAQSIADGGRAEHDGRVAKTIREQAIADMAAVGIVISPSEAAAALKVLPKHAALANKHQDFVQFF